MTVRGWTRTFDISAVLLIVGFGSLLINLPGAPIVAPWLIALGAGGVLVASVGRLVARRRERLEADAAAAQAVDESDRDDREQ